MANISIRKSNFTVNNGYFYTFDEDQDALLQKTDDGNNAFSYPCDTLLTNQIGSLEYDGVYFWTMETVAAGLDIKRWKVDNYVTVLEQTINLVTSSSHIYSASAFTVEHYHTNLTTTVSGGETTIYIDDYSNNPKVIANAILHLGPNENGEEEEVQVTGTVFGGVTITPAIENPYTSGETINFHRRIWLFNNYNGNDSSTGALYKFDSHSGGYMDKYAGGAYKSITACTFYKISSFQALGAKDMLMYAKGTNTLFVNVEEDQKTLYDTDTVNDTFTGSDGSSPSSTRWSVESGTPTIQSNALEMDVTTYPTIEAIQSKYFLPGDFDVSVNCSLTNYNAAYAGVGYMECSMKLTFPNEQDRFCKISRGYSTEFGSGEYQNFSVSIRKATDTVLTTISGMDIHPDADIDNYKLRIRRVETDVHFYVTPTVSGILQNEYYLGVESMFDSDAQLILSVDNNTDAAVRNTFDTLSYTGGSIAYISTAIKLPYYGSMVMDNVESDGYTIIPLQDMSVDRNNMYRLHGTSTFNYSLSPLESFVTSISLSASPAIIAANGLSTTDIKAWVKDQFLQPIVARRVTFTENGDGSITGGTDQNTDADGYAQTEYRAGTAAQSVLVTATVQQTN
jgi:hypothetical protein